jgi:hypothetical protein
VSDACREQCDRSGEPLAGSAGDARTFVAIAWPKRRWHADKASRSEGLPAELAEIEARAKRAGTPVALRVFQRGPGADTEAVEVLCYRSGAASFRAPAVPLERLTALLECALAGAEPDVVTEPLGRELLVCTDGRHDDCCARFGRPVYRALCDEAAKLGAGLSVSESSHLGGHRFAANLLALPTGDLYGRVETRDAAALVNALRRDRLLRYRYRGRLGASEAAAAADALLAARLPEGASWEFEDDEPLAGAADCRLRARVREGQRSRAVGVRCETRPFSGPTSCGAESETRTRWVAVALEEERA